jgi:hypothetical protein
MTSGVSRSRSLPFSAMAGEAKTSAISAMHTLHARPTIVGKIPTQRTGTGFDIPIHALDRSVPRNQEKFVRARTRKASGKWMG